MKKNYLLLSVIIVVVLLVGCVSARKYENPPGSGQYTNDYVVDPRLVTALETAKATNTATAPLNPYSPVVDIALLAATSIAGWFAKRKNDEAAANKKLLTTVVQGVEQADNAQVKTAIRDHAVRVGVEGDLNTAVAKITSGQI